MRSQLPAPLLELHEKYTLHDAEVKLIESRFESAQLKIVLDGWDQELENPLEYSLAFTRLVEFVQVVPSRPEIGEGDVGYWECEALNAGIEVRMLFLSGTEFRILFEGFTFEQIRREA